MTNEEFAFNYADKEFMPYGNRVALVGHDSENPHAVIESPVETRTDGTLVEPDAPDAPDAPVDPRPRTIGELIKEHEGVRGILFSTDEHEVFNFRQTGTVMYRPPISEVSTES